MSEPLPTSVIIVNYNAGAVLRDCVESVLAASGDPQIIVVDNGSTDSSLQQIAEIMATRSHCEIVRNDGNIGFSAAVNVGATHATGDYLVLLNPDCVIQRHTLQSTIRVFDDYPGAGIVGALIFGADGREQSGSRRREPSLSRSLRRFLVIDRIPLLSGSGPLNQHREPLPKTPILVDAVSGSFLVIKREIFSAIGAMDENYFLHCEDLDLCRRVREAGYNVVFAPNISVVHYKGVSSRSAPLRVAWHKHRGMWRYYQKFQRPVHSRLTMFLVGVGIIARFVAVAVAHGLSAVLRPYSQPHAGSESRSAGVPVQDNGDRTLLLFGASSMVGARLRSQLRDAGWNVIAVGRQVSAHANRERDWFIPMEYFEKVPDADFVRVTVLINTAPVWILPMVLMKAKRLGVKRIVALSSTSVLTKRASSNRHELEIVGALEDGERYIARFCSLFDIEYTVLRTTMIFDGVNDKNVVTIAKLLKWLPRFPLPGCSTGLRQPIHADDVGDACVAALNSNQSYGKVYNIGGGQTLSYREMVVAIAQAAGYRARFVSVPINSLRIALGILGYVPGFRHLTASMADRVNEDLCFKNDRFITDCGFSPRPFSLSIGTIRSP